MTDTSTRRRATFNTLTVAGVRKLTKDSVEVTFTVPDELAADYDYLPGQYVALRAQIDGQEVRRSYSICAEPTPGEIRVAIKRDFGGLFSNWANDTLEPGYQIDVMNPQGAFVSKSTITSLNNPEKIAEDAAAAGGEHMIAFAAGSGITPIIAIARTVLKTRPTSTFDLVYANKSAMDVMFAEEIGDLKDRYPTRFAVHHVLSREQRINPLMSGRIDDEKLNAILDHVIQVDKADEWFLCGPFELVQLCRDTLAARGVREDDVRFELFTTGKPEAPAGQQGRAVEADSAGANYAISFNLDGTSSSVESPVSANETILNAALRVRADVPFACAGGVCGTCRAKVVSGDVKMEENYALEKDEVEAGYILTCQTRPCSDAVTVDFNA
ncbi:phenylacetate-CoA oxygenase/reductase subunit PaaK [Rothia nasimurium]|uniref:Phenylacetate-CoA oxygenase/reductase subunit PaaK n=1 Tax=Rothia nasimurium TaxID=85336 RepID=A0A4Y9F2E0_9MICC|nr:1,2-phenylacetyl-CoA epoxidase subunit PaaE [Rothia nasimurium]MBF0808638.1 phenylacetate-CoA oxygenase/reductase subunit PaaK [Rothia nasimurium]TFU21645.1 phenylacetate-CoA oxygenase/reductase subunit PaaK [Rothia nasimurium]